MERVISGLCDISYVAELIPHPAEKSFTGAFSLLATGSIHRRPEVSGLQVAAQEASERNLSVH